MSDFQPEIHPNADTLGAKIDVMLARQKIELSGFEGG